MTHPRTPRTHSIEPLEARIAPAAVVDVATTGKSATFTDWDGDLVTIKSSKGPLDPAQFQLSSPNPLTGGAHLVSADFTDANLFTKSNLTFTAKRGPMGGDGLVNVGTIDARGVVLGTVTVDGDLQQLDAAGAAALTVYSLGQFVAAGVQGAPLTSTIDGTLGALTVKTDATGVILTAKNFGAVKALNLDGVQIFAAGVVNPATPAAALAIKSLTVSGTVRDSQILAGYDATGAAFNADVAIGAVKVVGQWVASNLVAGVRAGDDGIFATGDTNETLVAGGNAIVAKITSIAIGGAAFGTLGDLRDGFGFAAEEIGALSLGKAKVPLQTGARNDTTSLLAGVTGDVRARETGTPGAPAALIAGAAGPAAIGLGSLGAQTGFKVSGVADGDLAGFSVRGAGDVNGDGFGDFIIGAERADEGGLPGADRGAAYVVFGKADGYPAGLALSALVGSNGFKLSGAVELDSAGYSVSAAGDVNGDGFDDVIVGAPGANAGGGTAANRGEAYVIFGKAMGFGASLLVGSLTASDGFTILGIADGDQAGFSVSGAGDVNGDGFADVIIGANNADTVAGDDRGAAYVVFGKPGSFGTSVPLATLGAGDGFKLTGAADGDGAGFSVGGAGDVNGDGFDDFLVGATYANESGSDRGAVYLVFGRAGGFGTVVELSGLASSDGFKISGAADGDRAGYSLSAAGDINGDGFDEIIIGASKADGGTPDGDRGAAYVLFGKAGVGTSVLLSGLDGTNGFKLGGIAEDDRAGISVSGAGDVNGDGLDDLIVGAFKADESFTLDANRGAAYVIFGQTAAFGASMVLSAIDGTNGFKLSGVNFSDYAGFSVSGAGDVNGDGFADLLVGAYSVDGAGTDRGAAYVVYGSGTAEVTVATTGTSATFIDWDGDLVTIKATKGPLDAAQFKLSSTNPLTGGAHLIYADFTAGAGFANANITFTAKRGPTGGDGLVNVGTIDARGVLLGKVSVDGDLQQLDAAGAAGLTVYSLGQFAAADVHGAPLTSEFGLKLGALTVKTDASRVMLTAQTFGAIKAASFDGVKIFAAGVTNPATIAQALAIKSFTATGSVSDSQILAGYDAAGAAFNADVQIGAVKVTGQWIASNLVAGVIKGIDGIFGTGDDARIGGGNAIVSKIASITIGGAAMGTPGNLLDGFGFVAEQIGTFKVGKATIPLLRDAHTDLIPVLVGTTGDLRVREVA